MARRSIVVKGETWEVYPSGRVITRYAPVESRSPGAAFAELSDDELRALLQTSQPAWTAPEAAYGAR